MADGCITRSTTTPRPLPHTLNILADVMFVNSHHSQKPQNYYLGVLGVALFMLKNGDDEKETMQCYRSAIASNLHQIVTSSVVRVTCVDCLAASGPVTWCDVRLHTVGPSL